MQSATTLINKISTSLLIIVSILTSQTIVYDLINKDFTMVWCISNNDNKNDDDNHVIIVGIDASVISYFLVTLASR